MDSFERDGGLNVNTAFLQQVRLVQRFSNDYNPFKTFLENRGAFSSRFFAGEAIKGFKTQRKNGCKIYGLKRGGGCDNDKRFRYPFFNKKSIPIDIWDDCGIGAWVQPKPVCWEFKISFCSVVFGLVSLVNIIKLYCP